MTRRIFSDGDVFYAEDANQIAYPIPDGQDYIGHGPKIIDSYLDDGNDQIKSRFYSFYDRFKVTHQSGLTFNYLGGSVLLSNGNIVTISTGSINIPDNTTVYIFINSNGLVQQSSVLPNESFPLAKLTTAEGSLSGNIIDLRDKLVDRISPSTIPSTEIVPTGMMTEFAGNTAPTGWLLCNGAEYQINSYPALYAVIGTTYGGNGTTTFRVPDRRGRVGLGAGQGAGLTNRTLGQSGGQETVTLNVSQIPSHNHGINDPGHNHAISDPGHNHGINDPGHSHKVRVNRNDGTGNYIADSNGGHQFLVTNEFEALTSGTNISILGARSGINLSAASTGITTNTQGGNGSHENMPPFLVVHYIIKT
ncbi:MULTISPECIES: tail fiber protein [Calothrix]|uniref:Tail fiber protein n=2 Tax=Calothrix TaxID=1186 RepID=A0ABR8AAD0_9CYAN|nr:MULTISPECIES: tail fiber protein [Calothrix]MBD2196624.1 tail fiber protein [Calothrix parietina FACHB-288]MBD2228011.1 tail fiber protein [Calothrix anomala FACHB-343]